MDTKNTKNVFNLKEVGYLDLDGNSIKINFEQKDFANALFANAQSIEMDAFAREIHKCGQAEVTEMIKQELLAITATMYKHRVVQAIKESLGE